MNPIEPTHDPDERPASDGVMGSVRPSREQRGDIEFGWPLLDRIVTLEVGLAIAVRERDVIAAGAAEGIEALIERAGALCRARGWTLLTTGAGQVAGPPPRIGVETIRSLRRAGAGCLAVGSGRVMLVDRPAVVAAADRAGIAVVGVGAVDTLASGKE